MNTDTEQLMKKLHASLCPDKLEAEIRDKFLALQTEVKHLNLHLKATQSGRDAALARLAITEEANSMLLARNKWLEHTLEVAGASPVQPSQLTFDKMREALRDLKREVVLSDVPLDYIKSHPQKWLDNARAALDAADALEAAQAEIKVQTRAADHWMAEANKSHNLTVTQQAEIERLNGYVQKANMDVTAACVERDKALARLAESEAQNLMARQIILEHGEGVAGASPVEPLTKTQIEKGMMALLWCAASDLERLNPNMYEGYKDDVTRVYSAITTETTRNS